MTQPNEEYDAEDDFYDENGNVSAGGLYDVGGHPIPERFADMADYLYEREKDRRMFGE